MKFLIELTEGMLEFDAVDRLKAKEALETFESIAQKLRDDPRAYRWRLIDYDEERFPAFFKDLRARMRVMRYQIKGIPSELYNKKSGNCRTLIRYIVVRILNRFRRGKSKEGTVS